MTGSEVSNNNYNKSSPLSCSCREDFFLDHTETERADMIGTCNPCPIGADCNSNGATLKSLPVMSNFWRSSINSSNLEMCESEESCRNDTCVEGYEGPICSVCSDGYSVNAKGDCRECEWFGLNFTFYFVCGVC